jgi:hypothetical protein
MFYSLLGRLVWTAAKLFLRRKYGRTYVPKSLLGLLAAAVVGLGFVVLRRR